MTDALFWQHRKKNDDPFLEAPLPAAFYHPSLPLPLQAGESEIRLSPQRLPPSEGKENVDTPPQLTPQEKAFMGRTNTVLAKEMPTRDTPSPPDTSSKFNESWPSSERPSTLGGSPAEVPTNGREGAVLQEISSSSSRVGDNSGGGEESFDFSSFLRREKDVTPPKGEHGSGSQSSQQKQDSVLARYIHRFRHAAPQSRRERAGVGATKDLWWMSPPTRDTSSTSSVGTRPSLKPSCIPRRELTDRRDRSVSSTLSSGKVTSGIPRGRELRGGVQPPSFSKPRGHVTSDDSTDPETMLLQEKAQQLLELSESSLLSDPIVSSEGVGTSSPSLPSSDAGRTVYVPPEISPIREAEPMQHPSRGPGPAPRGAKRSERPEDDILYQWRLRRKMELARNQGQLTNKPQESSLEALRSRLLDGTAPSKPTQLRNKRDHTQLVRTTGTDPIPQAASTQTCLRTGKGSHPIGMGRPAVAGDVHTTCGVEVGAQQSTAASDVVGVRRPYNDDGWSQLDMQLGGRDHRVHESGGRNKPIAEPVASASERPPSDIPPHRHMSCDIIPCPHGNGPHQHHEKEQSVNLSERVDSLATQLGGNQEMDDHRGHHPDGKSDDRRKHHNDGKTNRQHRATEPGASILTGESTRGSVGLRTQGPHDEHCPSKTAGSPAAALGDKELRDGGEYSDSCGEDSARARKRERGLDSWREAGGRKDSIGVQGGVHRGVHQGDGFGNLRGAEADYGEDNLSRDIAEVGGPEGRKRIATRSEDDRGLGAENGQRVQPTLDGVDADTRDVEWREDFSTRSSDTEPFTDVSSEDLDAGAALKRPPSGPQDVVQSTVSQVIRKTVFDHDSSTAAPTTSKLPAEGVPQKHQGISRGLRPTGSYRSQHASSSDSEEFADDELLQMLRKKRALYEKQLEQIDDLILEKQGL